MSEENINRKKFTGMGVALVTPFNEDYTIDIPSLEALVDYQIGSGTDFLVVLGTTSETPTLPPADRREIIECVRRRVAGRLPMVIGVGGNCTEEIVHQLQTLDMTGYEAVLSVVPFYNKPCQEGMYRHFKAIAETSPLPVILYNVPGRTGVNMDAATTLRLAHDCPRIIGIKEASGNFRQIEEIIEKRPKDFLVLSGDDGITLPLMKFGADGVISVLGNVCPARFREMVHLCLEHNFDAATIIHERFHSLYDLLFRDGNPAGIKAALSAKGMIKNVLRLPLVPAKESTIQALHQALQML